MSGTEKARKRLREVLAEAYILAEADPDLRRPVSVKALRALDALSEALNEDQQEWIDEADGRLDKAGLL